MSVFYLLPPRPALGECLAKMLQPYVPGASINPNLCADFVDSLVSGSPEADDFYVVYREDLPEGEEVNTALREGLRAETGTTRLSACRLGRKRRSRDDQNVATGRLRELGGSISVCGIWLPFHAWLSANSRHERTPFFCDFPQIFSKIGSTFFYALHFIRTPSRAAGSR